MSKWRAPKRTKDCHNCFRLGTGKWTESESNFDSKTAGAAVEPSAEVHCPSLVSIEQEEKETQSHKGCYHSPIPN